MTGRSGTDYFDRQGQPMSREEWSTSFEDPAVKRVAETTVGGIWISTVWLGLDHGWGSSAPVIFETMAFARGLGWSELESRRYCTETEALAGHEEVVAIARRRHHGWVKHARDERRREMKYHLKQLERRAELAEIEELSLAFWLRRRS